MTAFRCMFYFGVLFVTLGYVSAIIEDEAIKKDFALYKEECAKEMKIDPENFTKGESMDVKCFSACVFDKFSVVDKGMMDVAALVEKLKMYISEDNNFETIKDIIEGCAVEVNNQEVSDGDKGCERAGNFLKCLGEKGEVFLAS